MKAQKFRSLEELWQVAWNHVEVSYSRAALYIVGIMVLAFGFEMTNLTLHHDDVAHIFIQDDILGHYLGRFGFGWVHLYLENAYIVPFVQVAEGVVFMTAYGLVIARFWGATKTLDIVLIAAVMGVFPYMGQLYQYNTSIAPFSLAHLFAALAVVLSTRRSLLCVALAVPLYTAAFSIYQSVIANAATIFGVWALTKAVFPDDKASLFVSVLRPSATAAIAVVLGGLLYLAIVSVQDLQFDSYQAAGEAFSLSETRDASRSAKQILQATRSFFFWPEPYFPSYLKDIQLVFLALATIVVLWLPKRLTLKAAAAVVFVFTLFAPRLLQLLHPAGTYHNLTLTGYAVVTAGLVLIVNKAGSALLRNLSSLLALLLIGGFVLQCNWISTVNYLNTMAHVTTMTQVLARLRSLPAPEWDGKTVAVVGRYDMPSDYPYRSATGVATEFLDAAHMQHLARLMRDEAIFIDQNEATPNVLKYAADHEKWPDPSSVSVVDGMGVVILSKENSGKH